jgi:hypothetical protein
MEQLISAGSVEGPGTARGRRRMRTKRRRVQRRLEERSKRREIGGEVVREGPC